MCALSVENALMKLGTIAHLKFPISAFLFLVRDGTALPVNILTMIGIVWVLRDTRILIVVPVI